MLGKDGVGKWKVKGGRGNTRAENPKIGSGREVKAGRLRTVRTAGCAESGKERRLYLVGKLVISIMYQQVKLLIR